MHPVIRSTFNEKFYFLRADNIWSNQLYIEYPNIQYWTFLYLIIRAIQISCNYSEQLIGLIFQWKFEKKSLITVLWYTTLLSPWYARNFWSVIFIRLYWRNLNLTWVKYCDQICTQWVLQSRTKTEAQSPEDRSPKP